MISLADLTAVQAMDALRKEECSSQELTVAYLDKIAQLEPKLNAYITQNSGPALKRAKKADFRRGGWEETDPPLSPLLGLPLAVKDVLSVAGMRTTAGSRILENFIPPYTATSVDRLTTAGMVILGKTNTDEFAMGSSTENSAYGVTHNPWALDRVPGGSSGGSAAAVAAHLAPIALGTDTGGSVRQPAAFCGITGLKTTYGRVSRYGLIAYGSSLDTVGVLARTVEDAAMLFPFISGFDTQDATSVNKPLPEINLPDVPDLAGIRIGVPKEYFISGIQAEVDAAVRQAIDAMQAMGAEIVEVSLPHTDTALPVYYIIAPAEASANLSRFDAVRYGMRTTSESLWPMMQESRGAGFGPEVKRRIMLGTYALSAGYYDAYYGQAQKVRTLIKRDFEQVFDSVDVIAAPITPSTAFRIGEHGDDPLSMYLEDVFSLPANLAGVPGLTFPVGFDAQGLPIGMQLMGPHFGEEKLLSVGHAYQQATDWHLRKPALLDRATPSEIENALR